MKTVERQGESIIEKAKKEADKIKRESLFETKEELNKLKIDVDKEIKEKKNEVKESEDRLLQREKNLDKRDEIMQNREKGLEEREKNLLNKQDEIQEIKNKTEEIKREQLEELERISGFTKEQAKESIMKIVEESNPRQYARLHYKHKKITHVSRCRTIKNTCPFTMQHKVFYLLGKKFLSACQSYGRKEETSQQG